jgi:TPR repeat protein
MTSDKTQSAILEKAKELYVLDEFKQCLAYISENETALKQEADFFYGEIYSEADKSIHGIANNLKKAASYYLKATEQGHAEAAYKLAMMHYLGDLGKENIKKAVVFLEKSASANYDIAMFELANIYYDNSTLDTASNAIDLYKKLVELDDDLKVNSLLKLGRIYTKGLFGISKDYSLGIEYLQAAADEGNQNALFDLVYIYFYGDHVEQDLAQAEAYLDKIDPGHIMYDDVYEKVKGTSN